MGLRKLDSFLDTSGNAIPSLLAPLCRLRVLLGEQRLLGLFTCSNPRQQSFLNIQRIEKSSRLVLQNGSLEADVALMLRLGLGKIGQTIVQAADQFETEEITHAVQVFQIGGRA